MTNATLIVDKNAVWYKQFWPWFLIFLPGSVVVASIITLVIAAKGADSLVVDDYYKKAMLINKDLTKIEHAKKIGLSGGLFIKDNTLQLEVNAKENSIVLPPVLKLHFVHPTTAEKDFSITLIQVQRATTNKLKLLISEHYNSQLSTALANKLNQGAWYVRLLPLDEAWQLNGKIHNNIKTIPLYAD